MLVLVRLLYLRDLSWSSSLSRRKRDEAAAAKFLGLAPDQVLASGSYSGVKKRRKGRGAEAFRPWWLLLQDGDELILSVRGSANVDDIAIDMACESCDFLHGLAHKGIANAAAAVWEEARPKVEEALAGAGSHRWSRLVVCGHSLGGAVALLLGMSLRAEAKLPLPVFAFAAGPPPVFSGEQRPELEAGLLTVINGLDPVPHLSLDAALRLVCAAERLAGAGLSWQKTLTLLVGGTVPDAPKVEELTAGLEQKSLDKLLRIPGQAIWLIDACSGRQVLAVDLGDKLPQFSDALPEISNAQSALDHIMPAYIKKMDKAYSRLRSM
ncbi:unnamed protein product [Polarella glacialis]|uniref:Fungal lipase-type domain-containing protein n=1 Tax=Polarella glacialis TaxID=89957 RepID=A0A813DQ05_POLGL|nr:unnamed protein product [Polarella glacialis]